MSSNVVVVLINSLLTMLWSGPGYEVWNSVVIVDIWDVYCGEVGVKSGSVGEV